MAAFDLNNYRTVAERLAEFHELYDGCITTEVLVANDEYVRVRADVYKNIDDFRPSATGHAEEKRGSSMVTRTSALEVCETSAVGRALAIMGLSVDRNQPIASREEVETAQAASRELDKRAELKQELIRATEAWVEIGELEFESVAEACRAYMNQELCIDVPEGAQLSAEQWDQLEKALTSVLAA